MSEITLTKQQARQFILRKQGLIGDYRFTGRDGILAFIRQAGCIQFDPIDVCGKNAELVLQSRVKGFTKKQLYELLYEERKLIDYFDKNLAIMPVEDWPYFEQIREAYRQHGRGRDEVDRISEEILTTIEQNGPVSSKDIGFDEKVDWYWSSTKLARAALETLYFRGDLIVHHKKGTNKYYDLAKNYIPEEILEAEDPYPGQLEHLKWRVLRRISAVGLLWNKPSDAWLNIWDLKAQERNQVFEELLRENTITELSVEGCKDRFYCLTEDLALLNEILAVPDVKNQEVPELKTQAVSEVKNQTASELKNQAAPELKVQAYSGMKARTELIAALDNMLWDRKLIKELFGFDYKWEIYTPAEQRKYGYYVLPILSGDRFIGRCEAVADYKKKVLTIKNVWLEKDVRLTKKLKEELDCCFKRFMKFHDCKEMIYAEEMAWQ